MNTLRTLAAIGLLLIFPVAAVQAATSARLGVVAPIPAAEVALDKGQRGELFYQLLLGELNAREGELNTSYALVLDAARRSNDSRLYRRAVDIALQARAGDAALQATRAWIQAHPTEQEAHRYLLQILIALNRVNETLVPLKASLELLPVADRAAAILSVPRGYARVANKKLAARMVEQALAGYLTDPAVGAAAWTAVGRIRLAAGDVVASLQAVQRAQAIDPYFESAAALALELLGLKQSQAQEQVTTYLQGNAKALPELRMSYARTLLAERRYAEAKVQLEIVTREKPEFAEGWLVLGALLLQDRQLASAKTVFLRFVELTQKQGQLPQFGRSLTQAYLALAQITAKQKDFVVAEKWLSKIDDSQELLQAQALRAFILTQQGRLEDARQLIQQVPENSPADARQKLIAELDLLRELGRYQLAYDVLVRATVEFPTDLDLLYDQAMMADKLNLFDEMERLLKQIMQMNPEYRHAYNALGYSLAQRNSRLSEAKELIQKALTYAPTDPFVQDSLGWVEFRLGNFEQAVQILQAAYKAQVDVEIAVHLGEVLWTAGQREEALNVWREGARLQPDNESLLETLKRLGVKL